MPVGPPRATRKPVLQVTDRGGRVLAFVKVGHDPLTAGLVAAEGQALARVAGLDLRRVRAAPAAGRPALERPRAARARAAAHRPGTPAARARPPARALLEVVLDVAQAGASPGAGTDALTRPAAGPA